MAELVILSLALSLAVIALLLALVAIHLSGEAEARIETLLHMQRRLKDVEGA